MRVRVLVASLLSGVALLAATQPAAADLWDKKHQADQAVSSARTSLENSSVAVQRAATALAEVRTQLPAARAAYFAVMGRINTARDQLQIIRDKLAVLKAQQASLQTQVTRAKTQITQTQDTMTNIVREQYQSGGLNEWEVVLSASSPSDFVQRLVTTQQVLSTQNAVVNQLAADQAVLTAKQQELQVNEDGVKQVEDQALGQLSSLRVLAKDAKQAKQQLEALAAKRSNAVAVARSQRAAEKLRYAAALRAQQQLQQAITNATSTGSTGSGAVATGELLWPVAGPMVQGVGWRVHPVFGYHSCHTGIDIGASTGTPIKAAAAGVVVWTNPDDGGPYGNNTLIDHGNGLSTFYAHQSAFNVSAGQRVTKGQVIGYVGATGWVTGPHLHFEVHINGVPYDPMGWFGGSKTPQSQFCPGS